jgi:hypothetical protein
MRVVPSLSVSCKIIPGADCERSAPANVCLPIGVGLALVSAVIRANMVSSVGSLPSRYQGIAGSRSCGCSVWATRDDNQNLHDCEVHSFCCCFSNKHASATKSRMSAVTNLSRCCNRASERAESVIGAAFSTPSRGGSHVTDLEDRARGLGRGRNKPRHGRHCQASRQGRFLPVPRMPEHVRVHRKRKLRPFPNSQSTNGQFAAIIAIARSSLKNRFPGRKNGRLISW